MKRKLMKRRRKPIVTMCPKTDTVGIIGYILTCFEFINTQYNELLKIFSFIAIIYYNLQ